MDGIGLCAIRGIGGDLQNPVSAAVRAFALNNPVPMRFRRQQHVAHCACRAIRALERRLARYDGTIRQLDLGRIGCQIDFGDAKLRQRLDGG
ncbi:MAG: hypothetical protein NXI27_00190 [Alphaproteobacteria bacterium]|nr:hypothetical protein [Alphaproteobacteria bacterium]